MSDLSLKTCVRAVPETVVADVGNEIALLSLPQGRYFGLNTSGASVWELIQQPISIENLLSGMLERFDIDERICHRDLLELLERMSAAGLIEVYDEGQPG